MWFKKNNLSKCHPRLTMRIWTKMYVECIYFQSILGNFKELGTLEVNRNDKYVGNTFIILIFVCHMGLIINATAGNNHRHHCDHHRHKAIYNLRDYQGVCFFFRSRIFFSLRGTAEVCFFLQKLFFLKGYSAFRGKNPIKFPLLKLAFCISFTS